MKLDQLDSIYQLYKFQVLPVNNDNIRVYSFTNKYFSNADIILLKPVSNEELKKVIHSVETLGFSVTVRDYKTISDAEESLFDGFFDIDRSKKQLQKSYRDHVQKIEDVIFGKYEYVKSEYYDIENNRLLKDDIVKTIIDNISQKGPVLILLEAPAGFGKTSTSYELIKHLTQQDSVKRIPLFTELSRNRQASIFKYVLYDEINSRFTGLSLELVIKHIIDGRIPLIIDGFDELLKSKSFDRTEDKFEDAEPMLETIKELLKTEAKIVLTTRRTAIFSDDDFFKWLEDNSSAFLFFRYSISEPTISDWISITREKQLKKAGLNLKSISNPVLLAYLKSMNDDLFDSCVNNIDLIIEGYINKLMERENERQDLNMTIEEQKKFLKIISAHFTNYDITADNKETLEKIIFESEQNLLFEVLERFTPDKRPSIDQLVNKLIIHAFLDRKGDMGHQIGFVNDFTLGSFVGANLIEEGDSWIGTERFIDFILTAYISRSSKIKRDLYEILNKNILNSIDIKKRVFVDNYLFGQINHDIRDDFFSDLEFRTYFNNNKIIQNCVFSECTFYSIDFGLELVKTLNVHFINCTFYNCSFTKEAIDFTDTGFTNCSFFPPNIIIGSGEEVSLKFDFPDTILYQKKVLEKFWQSGKERFIAHRRLSTLRSGIRPEEMPFIDAAIEELIKMELIIHKRGHHSLHLNIVNINRIKQILGR